VKGRIATRSRQRRRRSTAGDSAHARRFTGTGAGLPFGSSKVTVTDIAFLSRTMSSVVSRAS